MPCQLLSFNGWSAVSSGGGMEWYRMSSSWGGAVEPVCVLGFASGEIVFAGFGSDG